MPNHPERCRAVLPGPDEYPEPAACQPEPALPRVLLVDDEPHVLDGLRRSLRSEFAVDTAAGAVIGLQRIRDAGPYAVVLADYQMPHLNGASFLAEVRRLSPLTSRILLTGQADPAGTAAVVNEGEILRLLLKPAGHDELVEALHAGVTQYRLLAAERDRVDGMLHGCVRSLTELLALAAPSVFSYSDRLRALVAAIAAAGGLPDGWSLEVTAMLAELGAVTLPAAVFERYQQGQPLDADRLLIQALPAAAERVLAGIAGIGDVRTAILAQQAHWDGSGPVDRRAGTEIPLGGRLLRLARDFDQLRVLGVGPEAALTRLRSRHGRYDPELLDTLATVVADRTDHRPHQVSVAQLRVSMVLATDVHTVGGLRLVPSGQQLTETLLARIVNYAAMPTGVSEPLLVFPSSAAAQP